MVQKTRTTTIYLSQNKTVCKEVANFDDGTETVLFKICDESMNRLPLVLTFNEASSLFAALAELVVVREEKN